MDAEYEVPQHLVLMNVGDVIPLALPKPSRVDLFSSLDRLPVLSKHYEAVVDEIEDRHRMYLMSWPFAADLFNKVMCPSPTCNFDTSWIAATVFLSTKLCRLAGVSMATCATDAADALSALKHGHSTLLEALAAGAGASSNSRKRPRSIAITTEADRYAAPAAAFAAAPVYVAMFGTASAAGLDGLMMSELLVTLRALAPLCDLERLAALFGWAAIDLFFGELLSMIAEGSVPVASADDVAKAQVVLAWVHEVETECQCKFVAGDDTNPVRNHFYGVLRCIRLTHLSNSMIESLLHRSTCLFALREALEAWILRHVPGVEDPAIAWLAAQAMAIDQISAVHRSVHRAAAGSSAEILFLGGPIALACFAAPVELLLEPLCRDPLLHHRGFISEVFEEVLQQHGGSSISMREILHLQRSLGPANITCCLASDDAKYFRNAIAGLQWRAPHYEKLPSPILQTSAE
jgi:hypothetical protein